MKYLAVAIVAFAAFVAADEEWKPVSDKETFMKIEEDCAKEIGLTTEENDTIIKDHEYPDTKKMQEYVLCSIKRVGVFTEDKGYNLDRLMAQFGAMFENAEQFRDMAANCIDSNEQKSTPAEWAFRGRQCIMNTKIGEALKEAAKAKHS